MILHLRPHVRLFIFHFQVMKIKAIEKEYLPVSPTKLSTVPDFTSCGFQRVKSWWSYLGIRSPFVHWLPLLLSYLFAALVIVCSFSLVVNYSLRIPISIHQSFLKFLISYCPQYLSNVFRDPKPKLIFNHFFCQVV